jgi:mono/diheme cytochrome c family protein
MSRRPSLLALLGAVLLLAACEEQKQAAPGPGGGDPNLGRQVFLAQCSVCHGSDPAQRGPMGPPIKGASRELLEARILRGSYPPGYTPKQNTAVMQPIPQAAPHIADLAAYLR